MVQVASVERDPFGGGSGEIVTPHRSTTQTPPTGARWPRSQSNWTNQDEVEVAELRETIEPWRVLRIHGRKGGTAKTAGTDSELFMGSG